MQRQETKYLSTKKNEKKKNKIPIYLVVKFQAIRNGLMMKDLSNLHGIISLNLIAIDIPKNNHKISHDATKKISRAKLNTCKFLLRVCLVGE